MSQLVFNPAVEEVVSGVVAGSAVSLTTNITANVTSISVGAGVWDVSGNVSFISGATTSITVQRGGVTAASATLPTVGISPGVAGWAGAAIVNQSPTVSIPTTRITMVAAGTIYLVALSTFTVSTMAAFGYISARRVA